MNSLFRLSLILLVFSFLSCEKPGDGDGNNNNRTELTAALLKNWSEEVYPSYFTEASENFSIFKSTFEAAAEDSIIDSTELSEIQITHKTAWLSFVQLGPINFGPTDNFLLIAYGNTFPADSMLISENAENRNYNLDPVSQIDAQGFPALDYLLNSGITFNKARIQYTSELINRIESLLTVVADEFLSSSYQTTFQENNGSDINSSIAVATNAMIKEFEVIKNPRIGIPLGKKTLGQQRPEQVEALYGGYSLDLAKANWAAIQNIYYGVDFNNMDGTGLNELVEEDLSTDIDAQISLISESFNAIPTNNLQEALINHENELTTLHDAIQGLVVLWKTDMMSTLGLQINYQDNDGD